MTVAVAAVDVVLGLLGAAALYVAVCDFVDQWHTRRRPVRGPDGHWRMPRPRGTVR